MAIEFKTDFIQEQNKYLLYCDFNDVEVVEEKLDAAKEAEDNELYMACAMAFGLFFLMMTGVSIIAFTSGQKFDLMAILFFLIGAFLVAKSLHGFKKSERLQNEVQRLDEDSYSYARRIHEESFSPKDVEFTSDGLYLALLPLKVRGYACIPVNLFEIDNSLNDGIVIVKGFFRNETYKVQIFVNEKTYLQIKSMF